METLSFAEAMRRFIDDAPFNFAHVRRANREPNERVVTEFDVPFAVEDAYDTCVWLLDYDAPRAHIKVYRGTDATAAQAVFDDYNERLREFAARPGEPSEYDGGAIYWTQVYYATADGPWISVAHAASRTTEPPDYDVRVEVAGQDIECIDGLPEASPWHIILANTPLQAKPRDDND
jgi:hypothetical protein